MRNRELEHNFILLMVLFFAIIKSLLFIVIDTIRDSFRSAKEFNEICDKFSKPTVKSRNL